MWLVIPDWFILLLLGSSSFFSTVVHYGMFCHPFSEVQHCCHYFFTSRDDLGDGGGGDIDHYQN